MDADELIERYAHGERDFRGIMLRDAELAETSLSHADLRDADLTGVNLCSADLTLAEFTHATLLGANLEGADLRRANLRWALLSESVLRAADLSWANLQGAALHHANLSRAKLRGAGLCHADLSAAILTEADLTGAKLCAANLCDTKFERAIFANADLTGAIVRRRVPRAAPAESEGPDADARARALWRLIVEEQRQETPAPRVANPVPRDGVVRGALRATPYGFLAGLLASGLADLVGADRLSVVLLGAASFGAVTLAGALKGCRENRG